MLARPDNVRELPEFASTSNNQVKTGTSDSDD